MIFKFLFFFWLTFSPFIRSLLLQPRLSTFIHLIYIYLFRVLTHKIRSLYLWCSGMLSPCRSRTFFTTRLYALLPEPYSSFRINVYYVFNWCLRTTCFRSSYDNSKLLILQTKNCTDLSFRKINWKRAR